LIKKVSNNCYTNNSWNRFRSNSSCSNYRSKNNEKISCRGEGFVPIVSIVDYDLTLSKPRRLTIDSAIDTLTHGIEAYVSKKATLFSDRMALDTIRLVHKIFMLLIKIQKI
jgi:alcohol dehydrogenase class IV